jgi:hypothetical protein
LLESCAGEHSHAIGRPIALKTGLVIHPYGPAQFLSSTWQVYGDHVDPPMTFVGALGVATDPIRALWAYSGCVPAGSMTSAAANRWHPNSDPAAAQRVVDIFQRYGR